MTRLNGHREVLGGDAVMTELALRDVETAEDLGETVVEVMSKPPREATDRLESLRLNEFGLELPTDGDVLETAHDLILIQSLVDADEHPARGAVMSHEPDDGL